MDSHFFLSFFSFSFSKTLQYVVKRSRHRNIKVTKVIAIRMHFVRDLYANPRASCFGGKDNLVTSKRSAGKRAHNAVISSWNESSLWCPERSPYKIDIKSTARSVTKTFTADYVRLTCSKYTKRLACEREFSSVQIRSVQGAGKSPVRSLPSLVSFPNVAFETVPVFV